MSTGNGGGGGPVPPAGGNGDSDTSRFQALFGGILAYVLLALYAVSVFTLAVEVRTAGHAWDQKVKADPAAAKAGEPPVVPTPAGFATVMTTMGGLVSALVVAKLTQTKAGDAPQLLLAKTASSGAKQFSNILVALYLLVWLATGLMALVVGVMQYPGVNSTLADVGTTWLGLAVVAGYAYFGLTPPK